MLYSMEWQPREKSFYIILNKILCDENRSLLKPWFLYLKLFITALSKLPSIHCFVHRGIKKDLSADYPPGKIFVWWGFSSCTSSIMFSKMKHFWVKLVSEHYLQLIAILVKTFVNIQCSKRKMKSYYFLLVNSKLFHVWMRAMIWILFISKRLIHHILFLNLCPWAMHLDQWSHCHQFH